MGLPGRRTGHGLDVRATKSQLMKRKDKPDVASAGVVQGEAPPDGRLSVGVPGLDDVLEGGLLPRCAYLLRGGPGCGKTTLGLYFLTTG